MKNKLKKSLSNDQGSALALVLILITVLSTMLMSIAFLTQSASQTISQQAQNKNFKSDIFTAAYQQAMECLTIQKNCPGTGNSKTFGSVYDSCDVNNWFADLNSTEYGYGDVKIQCNQPPDSGLIQPMASYMLVGTGCDSPCSPQIGLDGGMVITNGGSCQPLNLNGGIINASGAWSGFTSSSCNLAFGSQESTIITPNPTALSVDPCPASNFGVSCDCPTGFTFGSGKCTSVNSFDSLNPKNSNSYLYAYLKYLGNQANRLFTSAGGYAAAPAQINSCSMSPGLIDNSILDNLNSKTTNSNSCATFTLNSGTYIFNASTDQYGSETASWKIDDGVNVTSNGEIHIVLANNSIIDIQNGSLTLTAGRAPSNSTLPTEPVIAVGEKSNNLYSSVVWDGLRRPAITIGASGNLITSGIIFAPAGAANIQNQSGAKFGNGVIFSGLKLNQNTTSFSGTVGAPSTYNGDRVVQLRFWFYVSKQDPSYELLCHPGKSNFNLPYCSTAGVDVGIVQLQLLDYFGIRTGSGYSVKVWQGP